MVAEDTQDKKYAHALKRVFDDIEQLSPREIEDKFYEVDDTFFPDTKPKHIMMQEIHSGIVHDLDPSCPDNNQKETLERFRKIITDYLSGSYYPSYFALSVNYADQHRGFTCNVKLQDNKLAVSCANEIIARRLGEIAGAAVVVDEEERDLENFQKSLPEQIGSLTLISSEIWQDYLVEAPSI